MHKNYLFLLFLGIIPGSVYSSDVSEPFAIICAATQKAVDEELEKFARAITELDQEILNTDNEILRANEQLDTLQNTYQKKIADLAELLRQNTDTAQRLISSLTAKKRAAEKAKLENTQKSEALRKKTAELLDEFVVLECEPHQKYSKREARRVDSSPNAGTERPPLKPQLMPVELWDLLPKSLQEYWGVPQ